MVGDSVALVVNAPHHLRIGARHLPDHEEGRLHTLRGSRGRVTRYRTIIECQHDLMIVKRQSFEVLHGADAGMLIGSTTSMRLTPSVPDGHCSASAVPVSKTSALRDFKRDHVGFGSILPARSAPACLLRPNADFAMFAGAPLKKRRKRRDRSRGPRPAAPPMSATLRGSRRCLALRRSNELHSDADIALSLVARWRRCREKSKRPSGSGPLLK
jgi:hypothetical protein